MSADFADLEAGNARYADRFADTGLAGRPGRPARQLAVVTCMDARIDPLAALGIAAGDANVLRNAGGRVTGDVLGALALARAALGVERVAVVVHTDCAAARTGTAGDQEAALRGDVDRLRAEPALDGVAVAGFRYDVATGGLTRLVG